MTDIERTRQNGLEHDQDARRDEAAAPVPDRDPARDTALGAPKSPPAGTPTGTPASAPTGIPTDADLPATGTGTGTGTSRPVTADKPADPPLGTPLRDKDKTAGPVADEPGPLVAGAEGHEPGAHHARHTGHGAHADPATRLVPAGTHDDLTDRLRQAVTGFVDQPRAAVEEADHVLEDLTARLAETLAGRRRTLRTSWQESADDTERLRLALRDYRETAEKLLNL
ncbi:hypothetical protein ABZ930_10565 [Streptomyces sp. NPDC046716]|uniref:hypothetical protein n=1 Tax=Streptomyces sp. NPDC046716 TaxID=3157093 RepID=UPI0033EA4C04